MAKYLPEFLDPLFEILDDPRYGFGFGLKDCDLDLYIDLGGKNVKEEFFMKARMWGPQFTTMYVLGLLREIDRFCNAYEILNTKIPIIKVKDTNTEIDCDINVVNRMGVKNSEYLAFCIGQDVRIHQLSRIIKYFCEVQDILGSGRGDHFNSYTLVMMIIFFLQSWKILHPVSVLQDIVPPEEINGWNFAFCQDMSRLPDLEGNKSTVSWMLYNFFKFYRDFNYNKLIICPWIGRPVKKCEFDFMKSHPKKDTIDSTFINKSARLEMYSAVTVQDPFELDRNVGQNVSGARLMYLKKEFTTAARLSKDLFK